MTGAAWYKRFGADFINGVVGLGPDVIGAYAVILDLMYSNGGPVRNDPHWLAGIMGCSSRRAKILIDKLLAIGKLTLEDGRLHNKRVAVEIEDAKKLSEKSRENGARGGRVRAENEREARKTNGLDQASLKLARARSDKIDTSLRSVSLSDANASSSETSSDTQAIPQRRKRASYPPDFEEFWHAYPTDALMSKKEAGQAWQRMPIADREAALRSLPAFRAYCGNHLQYRVIHAVRYLNKARWEGFNKITEKSGGKVFVAKGTPEWEAWQTVRKTAAVRSEEHKAEGWWFKTQWPPGPTSKRTTKEAAE